MNGRLKGQTAVITGAGRGLGRAIAVAFAGEGAATWICARTRSELDTTADHIRALGGWVEAHEVDLSDPDACIGFAFRVLEQSRHVDVLVNNAAVLRFVPIEDVSLSEWADALAINLTAPFLLTRAVLPAMRERGGSLINVSSRAGVLGFARETPYCASKFGLEGFTRAVALELAGARVSVNTVTPGLRIKPTSLADADVPDRSAEERDAWNDPGLLAPAFLYLAQLRGEVSGLRFDAHRLTLALARQGAQLTPERVKELAE